MAVQPEDEEAAIPVPVLRTPVRRGRRIPPMRPPAGDDHEGVGPVLLRPRVLEGRPVPEAAPPGPGVPNGRRPMGAPVRATRVRGPPYPPHRSAWAEPPLRREAAQGRPRGILLLAHGPRHAALRRRSEPNTGQGMGPSEGVVPGGAGPPPVPARLRGDGRPRGVQRMDGHDAVADAARRRLVLPVVAEQQPDGAAERERRGLASASWAAPDGQRAGPPPGLDGPPRLRVS